MLNKQVIKASPALTSKIAEKLHPTGTQDNPASRILYPSTTAGSFQSRNLFPAMSSGL